MTPPRVLIIAGSDSGGGAGIQADIKSVTMLGGFAMTAITALTAQNTLGVDEVMAVPTEMVLRQIDSVAGDLGVDVIKIGMIGSAATAMAVADRIGPMGVPIVFDPVMIATSGSVLADGATIAAFERLMRLSVLVTPNLPELEHLAGRPLRDEQAIETAAAAIRDRLGCAVLAKGGHSNSDPVRDLLVMEGGPVVRYEHVRVDTDQTHGTGCSLASAIAAGIGAGLGLEAAVGRATAYVHQALSNAPGFGRGNGPIGHSLGRVPFDH